MSLGLAVTACGGGSTDAPDTEGLLSQAGGPNSPPALVSARIVPITGHAPAPDTLATIALAEDGLTISGRVLAPGGAPVPGAELLLVGRSLSHGRLVEGLRGETRTDEHGSFTIQGNVSPRSRAPDQRGWRLIVRADGYPTWTGRPVSRGGAPDVQLRDGREHTLCLMFEDGTPLVDAGLRITRDPDVLPLFPRTGSPDRLRLGMTDGDGRLTCVLPVDTRALRLAIQHPDHRSLREVELDGDTDHTTLVLPRDRAIEVLAHVDEDAWRRRGLSPPRPDLRHVHQPNISDVGYTAWPFAFTYSEKSDGSLSVFEHLTESPFRITMNNYTSDDAEPLTDVLVAPPGRMRIEVTIPDPEPFEPGVSFWGLQLELVDEHGAPRSPSLRNADVPMIRMVGAGGLRGLRAQRAGLVHAVSRDSRRLVPPLEVSLSDDSGQSVSGVGPGDVVRFVVPAPERPETTVATPEATATNDHTPDAEPAVAPHGRFGGTITVSGDPWAYACELRLTNTAPLSAPGTPPPEQQFRANTHGRDTQLPVIRGGFDGRVAPGHYRVAVRLSRPSDPSRLRALGLAPDEGHADELGWIDLPDVGALNIVEGERIELGLAVAGPAPRTMVRIAIEPLNSAEGSGAWGLDALLSLRADVVWTPDGNGAKKLSVRRAIQRDGIEVDLPPGSGTLEVRRHHGFGPERMTFYARADLAVPPHRDADGNDQALEVTLPLRPEPARRTGRRD